MITIRDEIILILIEPNRIICFESTLMVQGELIFVGIRKLS